MQLPPLAFTDLALLFAVGSIVMLLLAELSSSYYGLTNLLLNRQRLKNAAYITGIMFLLIAVLMVINIIVT